MTEKIDMLFSELEKMRAQLEPKATPVFENVLRVLEKLVVPIMLGILAWLGSQAAAKISNGQLELARSAVEDRKVEFRRSMQAKYIEIFYKDLNSGDQKSQANAVRLMRIVDGDLAQGLLDLVAVTPGVSAAVVEQASVVKKEIEATAPLKGFKIGIYFYGNDPASMATVAKVRERLKVAGLTGVVQDYASDDAFFEKVTAPQSLEIRYESGLEDEAANALLAIVNKDDANKARWALKQVANRTSNFISVFVPRGG